MNAASKASSKHRGKVWSVWIVIILILFCLLFWYLKPDVFKRVEQAHADDHKSKLQMADTPQSLALQEQHHSRVGAAESRETSVQTSQGAIWYDTKSDLTIQPVDPETDPANKIDKIEEQNEHQ